MKNLYHGSQSDFDQFKIPKHHKNGGTLGFGTYLTNSLERANSYADKDGYLYTVKLNDELVKSKPLSATKVTLTTDQVSQIIGKVAEKQIEEEEYPYILSNYAEPTSEVTMDAGNQAIVQQMAETMIDDTDDLNIINEINNELGGNDVGAETLVPILNDAGIHYTELDVDYYGDSKEYIVFNPKDITIKGKERSQLGQMIDRKLAKLPGQHEQVAELQKPVTLDSKPIEISDDLVRSLQREKSMGRPQNEELRQEVVPEFQEWRPEMGLAASGQIVQQKKDYWKGVFDRSEDHGFELTDSENNTRITLTKSSRPDVDWQLTQYDSNGPYGHTDIVGNLDQPKVQDKIMSRLIYKSGYVVKYSGRLEKSMDKNINDTHETYQPVSGLNAVRESLIQTPTVIEKIKPSQAPFVKEIASKAEFAHSYDYDEVGREYSAYRTEEGNDFYECGAEDYVDKDNLKALLTDSLNENEITVENVVGPKLATKLTDKTQKFVNEHLTNDGLQQQVNGLKRLKSAVNPSQIAQVNKSLQLANREAGRRGLDLSQNMSMQAMNRQTIKR